MIKIAIIGATGKIGTRIVALAREQPARFDVVGTISRKEQEIGSPQVVIDFSSLDSMRKWLRFCCDQRIAIVIGTTGLSDGDQTAIDAAARTIPILQTTNTSVGVAVLNHLVAQAVKLLGPDCDIEIVETHHRSKKDAPSGTAKTLEKSIGREVQMHSLRIGNEIGTHTIHFALADEKIELTHRAISRDLFAHGALHAAEWLATQPPGRYEIDDMLSI